MNTVKIPWGLVFLLATFYPHGAQAQEKQKGETKPPRNPGRFFSRPVDLWKSGLAFPGRTLKEPPAPLAPLPGHVQIRRTIWAEPIKLPDGRTVLYVPPPQVLEFLENPTLETARAYHAFQRKRAEKMRKALLLLARVKEELANERGGARRPPEGKRAPELPSNGDPFTLLYFHSAT